MVEWSNMDCCYLKIAGRDIFEKIQTPIAHDESTSSTSKFCVELLVHI